MRYCVCLVLLTGSLAGSCFVGCDSRQPVVKSTGDARTVPAPERDYGADIAKIVSSEEMILELTRPLRALNRSVLNLQLPCGEASALFAPDVTVTDVGATPLSDPVNDYMTRLLWPIGAPRPLDEQGIWKNLFDAVAWFESARFYFIDGNLAPDNETFHANIGFAAHTRLADGSTGYVTAKIKTEWAWTDSQKLQMHIINWHTGKLQCTVTDGLLFEDVTDRQILDSALAEELGMSFHQEINRLLILGKKIKRQDGHPYRLFFPEVTLEHPCVAVVDLNSDGFDDFFVGRMHTNSLFFENNGDGTFSEIGSRIGLQLERDCTCALFADYDNDGDQDVFVGRARWPARYLENVDGQFRDATAQRIRGELPSLVSSICAGDYNRDGLLDVYFSTYSPNEGSHGVNVGNRHLWPDQFLTEADAEAFRQRLKTAHPFVRMAGPPNLLLENRGDHFEKAPHSDLVAAWRKSFQATFSDFDQDGDPDLYVCNDFAADDFFRNDGSDGFARVNEEVGLDDLGFGMGVAWGDHNNDGTPDLYVSNMYSKAGRRITSQIADIDSTYRQMAAGNFLYELRQGRFHLVSDDDGPQHAVARAGWSWGGQFTDIDNDGRLDIFVANGYYSAPPELAEDIDL